MQFSKYCEPILHLSGDFVKIVRTEHVGHAKTLVESLDRLPDVIVVAGGDGTSSEVVTGLLRRKDGACPLVLLPLGERSETALQCLSYSPSTKIEKLKALSNSLLPLLHRRLKDQNVMQFNILAEEEQTDVASSHKPIYALRQFSWGLLKGIEEERSKYWYLGFLKHHASVFANALSNNTQWTVLAKLILPPRNCLHCVEVNRSRKSWFRANRADVFCDNCEKEKIHELEANQVDIICNQIREDVAKEESSWKSKEELQANFIKSLPKGIGFLENVFNVVEHRLKPTEIMNMPSVQLVPAPTNNESTVYYIDGEEYDARPVHISLRPNAIRVFC